MTVHAITRLLRQKGYRLTRQRERILNSLTAHPQSIEELFESIKQHGSPVDKTTIYRTLDCLVDLGFAMKTQFRDKTAKYELRQEGDHHHHLVCDRCGLVEDVILNESRFLRSIGKQSNFHILSHTLEFFGLCRTCKRL